jgi:hypothetical protein
MRKHLTLPKKTLGDFRPCANRDAGALCVPATSGLSATGRTPADRCLADGSYCIPSRMHMLPPPSADSEVMLPAPMPRGVHLGYNEFGSPVYFATCADGRVLYGVHSPGPIEEAYVVIRLWAVLDREDPPSDRSRVSAAAAVLPFASPQLRPRTA